jgi:hypothetical protein
LRCGARLAKRARLPASHCGSRQGDSRRPRLSVRPCFLGRSRSLRSYGPPTGAKIASLSADVTRRIYISSAGRPFIRSTSASGQRSATGEQVGASGANPAGGLQAVSVNGHTIVLQTIMGNWGRNLRVELAPGGSSCSAQMSVAKEVGSAPKAFRGPMTGKMIEIYTVTVNGISCSAQQGNVFAN